VKAPNGLGEIPGAVGGRSVAPGGQFIGISPAAAAAALAATAALLAPG